MTTTPTPQNRFLRLIYRLLGLTWRDLFLLVLPLLLAFAVVVFVAVKFVRPAPPDIIRFIGGDPESSMHRLATRYKEAIEKKAGVKVEIVPSEGSVDTLKKLMDRKLPVDVGFVQGGLVEDGKVDGLEVTNLVSLGSMLSQPITVYYRGPEAMDALVGFKGKRIAIGPEGSGTRKLAMILLKANGLEEKNAIFLGIEAEEAVEALLKGTVDVAFFTGDSATGRLQRKLRESPDVHLMNFRHAEAYRRRFTFLTRVTLPEGSRDLATNWPPRNTELIGPIVELVARDDLHPALSDLLVGAAQVIHSSPSMYREAKQYPQAVERDFPLSPDAVRFYASGGKFLYKHLPFWLASMTDRLLVLIFPLLVILVPATKVIPAIYQWRVRSRIYRWYGALMTIERDMRKNPSEEMRAHIHERIDEIEQAVATLRTPVSFADQLYVLRDHVAAVRRRLPLDKKS